MTEVKQRFVVVHRLTNGVQNDEFFSSVKAIATVYFVLCSLYNAELFSSEFVRKFKLTIFIFKKMYFFPFICGVAR